MEHLSKEIYCHFPNVDVFWFGSSIYNCFNHNDIDVMLLKNVKGASVSICNKIRRLKFDILENNYVPGFHLNNKKLELVINNYLKNYNWENYKTKFIFGPIGEEHCVQKLLHIKGIITTGEFEFFSKFFPYHAKSILNNIIHLRGSADLSWINDEIVLTLDELRIWTKALKARYNATTDINSKLKYLNRIRYMKHMFENNNYNLDGFHYWNEYSYNCDEALQSIYNQIIL